LQKPVTKKRETLTGGNTVVNEKQYNEHWDLIPNRKITLSKKVNKEIEIKLTGEVQKLRWHQLHIKGRPYILGGILQIAFLGMSSEEMLGWEKIEKTLKAIALKDKKIITDGGTARIILFTHPEVYKIYERPEYNRDLARLYITRYRNIQKIATAYMAELVMAKLDPVY
jgi:hypothetical protein